MTDQPTTPAAYGANESTSRPDQATAAGQNLTFTAPAADRDTLLRVAARIGQMADYWEQHPPEVIRTPAVVSAIRAALEPAAVLPAPTDQTAALAEHLVERCPDHGCVEPPWEDGCHCEIVPLLCRLAGEARQDQPIVSTADKAEALGMTPTEYRAHSHRAAVEAVRAAAQGLYADAGLRVMAVLDEAQQDPTQDGMEAHRCGNCDGIDPDTCLMNADRPKPPPMDPLHILGIEGAPAHCTGDAGFCSEHGFHRHPVARPGQPETDEETDRA